MDGRRRWRYRGTECPRLRRRDGDARRRRHDDGRARGLGADVRGRLGPRCDRRRRRRDGRRRDHDHRHRRIRSGLTRQRRARRRRRLARRHARDLVVELQVPRHASGPPVQEADDRQHAQQCGRKRYPLPSAPRVARATERFTERPQRIEIVVALGERRSAVRALVPAHAVRFPARRTRRAPRRLVAEPPLLVIRHRTRRTQSDSLLCRRQPRTRARSQYERRDTWLRGC